MALNYVTVTGTFQDGSGNPLPLAGQTAYAMFTPSTAVFASGIPLITPAQPIQAPIISGSLRGETGGALLLLATDNTGITFGGLTGFFYWTVQVFIAGQIVETFSFFLPHTPSTADLSALANTSAGGGGGGFSNPMTTLGDLMYENATPAAARLAGNTTTAKQFLTQTGTGSVSAAPAWGTIAAGDVPGFDGVTVTGTPSSGMVPMATSGSAATWQNVPGVQVLTFTYGASGAVPSSGTFTAGTAAVDQNNILRVCTASGTPGTWARAGAQPYQFWIDDYGAKGDGRQALVTTAAGSAIINTTPLAAPAAPTVSNSGSGGTVAAGVYQVIVTYVNKWGETLGSSSSSTTTSGSTSTITVNSPAPSGNATGWYAYVTQPGGSTYFRQQGAGSPSTMEVPLILTAPPTNTGANPPGADSSAAQVFTSTAVDGGKNIMICGGLGSPGTPWVDAIATVQSPTQATLSSNGAGQGGNVSQAGCAAVFSSDDRLSVDQCITAARAYALANDNFCQAIGSSKIYGLGANFFQSITTTAGGPGLQYNTQVRVPDGNPSGQAEKLEFQLLGPGDNTHAEFWVSQLVNLNGCTFVSYSVGPTSADPTYGQQSVIGGPLGGINFNGSNGFANAKAVIRGVQVVQPGWSNSIGIDLQWISGCRVNVSSQAFAPTTSIGGGINPSSNWISNSFFQGKIGIGMRLPNQLNNDDIIVESFATEGITMGLYSEADHVIIHRLLTINENTCLRLAGFNNQAHALTIHQWSFENINGALTTDGSGNNVMVDITMDGENTSVSFDINDTGNALMGIVHWTDVFRTAVSGVVAPTVNGGGNLEIVNCRVTRGNITAPSVPATTVALQNPFWRHAWVIVSGGTVSAISVDGVSTGLTSGAFRVPSGKTITLTYSSAPTWKWWLD